jgi:hypothetical protein
MLWVFLCVVAFRPKKTLLVREAAGRVSVLNLISGH